MMIQSNFDMNVARSTGRKAFDGDHEYAHYCRIELGPLSQGEAVEKARDIAARFPAPEFNVTLQHVECSGRSVGF